MPWWSPHSWTTRNQPYSDLFWAVSAAVARTTRCSHCPKKLWAGTEVMTGAEIDQPVRGLTSLWAAGIMQSWQVQGGPV